MKIWVNYLVILVVWVVFWINSFVDAAWKDEACIDSTLNEKWCLDLSSEYEWPYCLSSDVDYASTCIRPALTNKSSSISNGVATTKMEEFHAVDVIKLYCESLYWKSDAWRIYFSSPRPDGHWDWRQTIDSHQSLFLHAFCSSFKWEDWGSPFVNENDLVGDAFIKEWEKELDLPQKFEKKDQCSLVEWITLDDCDMAIYATQIYDAIMTDVYKIKFTQVLHVDSVDRREKRCVEDFMSWYYLIHKKYPQLKVEYPQTLKILESNMSLYRKKSLWTVKILDNDKLASLAEASWCPDGWDMVWMDFVACAMHSSQWNWYSLTPSSVTFLYNEMMQYRQFLTFYKRWVAQKYENTTDEKKKRIVIARGWDFDWYVNMQLKAVKLSQTSFEDFSMSYPIHIWMQMYIEKVKLFRKKWTKIHKLMKDLFQRLQNVQLLC